MKFFTCLYDGLYSPEEKAEFERFAHEAVSEYPSLMEKVSLLEFRCSNYEKILQLRDNSEVKK